MGSDTENYSTPISDTRKPLHCSKHWRFSDYLKVGFCFCFFRCKWSFKKRQFLGMIKQLLDATLADIKFIQSRQDNIQLGQALVGYYLSRLNKFWYPPSPCPIIAYYWHVCFEYKYEVSFFIPELNDWNDWQNFRAYLYVVLIHN